MPRSSLSLVFAASLLGATLFASVTHAGARRFAFSREPSVLDPGDAKFNAWTTVRAGREEYYNAIDQRLQFGLGLVPNLEASLYWNFSSVSQTRGASFDGEYRDTNFSLGSVSGEWRYRFLDPVADPLGLALSFEAGYGPNLVDLGGRAIFGKQLRDWLLVLNLLGTQRYESSVTGTVSRQALGATLSLGYYFTPTLVGGLEIVNSTLLDTGELTTSTIYAGPSLAFESAHYFLVLTAAPQVFAPKKADDDAYFELEQNEHLWTRLVLGFRL